MTMMWRSHLGLLLPKPKAGNDEDYYNIGLFFSSEVSVDYRNLKKKSVTLL